MIVSGKIEHLWRKIVRAPLLSPAGVVRLLLLWPLTALYWVGMTLSWYFNSIGKRLSCPVISVGNLSVGGTGKTPFVGWLAGELRAHGRRVGIVCSGYGRLSDATFVATGAELGSYNPTAIGDEVALLASWLPKCTFSISATKAEAVAALAESQAVDLIIVDDGFQTRNLWRDLDILLLNTLAPESEYRLLPAGALRQPASYLGNANVVIYTNLKGSDVDSSSDSSSSSVEPRWLGELVSGASRGLTTIPKHRSSVLREVVGATDGFNISLLGAPALLVSGVADNSAVVNSAETLGVHLAGVIEFADHFRYDNQALEQIQRAVSETGSEWILTTEKDWVKLKQNFSEPDWLIPVAVMKQQVVVDNAERLLAQVEAVCEEHKLS